MVGKRAPTFERFLEKFEKGGDDECWNWTAVQNGAGYGMIWSPEAGRKVLAHRYSYEAFVGPIRADDLILHSCDNRLCVNPAHLRVGDHKQNVADMDQRGRRVTNTPRGEKNWNTNMTTRRVIAIRGAYVAGVPIKKICTRYCITEAAMHDYVSGRSWAHILGAKGCPGLPALQEEAKRRRRNNAKIDATTASEIRNRLSSGERGVDLASEFGVTKATISDIKVGRTWAK